MVRFAPWKVTATMTKSCRLNAGIQRWVFRGGPEFLREPARLTDLQVIPKRMGPHGRIGDISHGSVNTVNVMQRHRYSLQID